MVDTLPLAEFVLIFGQLAVLVMVLVVALVGLVLLMVIGGELGRRQG